MRLRLLRQAKTLRTVRWSIFVPRGETFCGDGWLLAAFCPKQGPRHVAAMWLMFTLAASIAPIGLILSRNYIRVSEGDRQE
jgi:hypothetical protein